MLKTPTIVAIGGGGFLSDSDWNPENSIEGWLLKLACTKADATDGYPPRVCFLGQASAESERMRCWFYEAFSQLNCRPTHFDAFTYTTSMGKNVTDLRKLILSQDLIYVGGGNTANMLAIWRAHGLDKILREAWQSGVVLSGMSAGANCWFQASVTDSFGLQLQPLTDGLSFLPGSCCPHYDKEEQRRPVFNKLVAEGTLPAGIGIDDAVAVVYKGTERSVVVSNRPNKAACEVYAGPHCGVETKIEARVIAGGHRDV